MFLLRVRYLLSFVLSLFGSFIAGFFGRFLGSEGTAIMITGRDLFLFGILLLVLLFLFCLFRFSLRKKYGLTLVLVFHACLFLLLSLWLSFFRSYALSFLSSLVILGMVSGTLPLPAPSSGPSSSSSWTEDSFGIDVLLESWPKSTEKGSTETGTSVNQPEAGRVPPANPVAPRGDEAGPSDPVMHFPYQQDEVIGGDSVISIQQRLLTKYVNPSYEEIEFARFDAEDRFLVKVEIIKWMTSLDPEGDWLGRGARALDNPHTATGEESLERLHDLLNDLNQGGVKSQAFLSLKAKVFKIREDLDGHSET